MLSMLLVMCMASPAEVLTAARLLRHTEATPNASRLFRAPVAAGMRPRAVACIVWVQDAPSVFWYRASQ